MRSTDAFAVGHYRYDIEAEEGTFTIEGEEQSMAGTGSLASGRVVPNSSVVVAYVGRSAIVLGTGGYSSPGESL